MNITIAFIVLAVIVVAGVIGLNYTWNKKGHDLFKVVPDTPPPPPRKPAPVGLFRPLFAEWFECYGECFRKSDVVRLTKNPNNTINVVLVDGHSINTGLMIDEVKQVLDIHYVPTMREYLSRHKQYKEMKDIMEGNH